MAKPRRKGGPKQKLSPAAAKAKAIRDKKYAMTDRRRRFKAESQRKDCPKGQDDHNTKKCVSSSYNRGGTQSKNKKDGTKAERRQNRR